MGVVTHWPLQRKGVRMGVELLAGRRGLLAVKRL